MFLVAVDFMNERLRDALQFREQGQLETSNALLLELAQAYPEDAFIHYQCAWSFDVLGEEAAAVPYYEKSLSLGLRDEHLENAFIGLGSTYRTLGAYEQSKATFLRGIEAFPENKAMQTFYALTLYNLDEHKEAVETLLTCLLQTTSDEDILSYKRALTFYAAHLDDIFR